MSKLKFLLPSNDEHQIKLSITITPLLPLYPENIKALLPKLQDFDRIIVQPLHATKKGVLAASIPEKAIQLKEEYR